MVRHTLACTAFSLALWLGLSPPAQAQTEVDLALVVAVDVSFSMDEGEQALQRDGFADAFRSREVHEAIRRGMLGRIAVTYVEWGGAGRQRVVIPWTLLDGPESIEAFAQKIAANPPTRMSYTSISSAIDYGVDLLERSGFEAARQVIDVSGDGANNEGRPVTEARDGAVAKGITVNGLPIMLKVNDYFATRNLDVYYRDCVIGGQGAFMVPVRDPAQFKDAIKTKIIMEIAGLTPEPPLLHRAQAQGTTNCMIGEILRRQRDRSNP